MSTALTVYDNVSDPLSFVDKFGTMIAKSRMFGCENEAQGQVLAMACLAEKQNPIAIKRTYHIIDGNLSMRADAMLAELRNRGGNHKIVKRTAEHAEITVEYEGESWAESLTWDEAKAEPWPFGKNKQLKKNWATPRARRQMLWARVVSEAVRTVAPEIIAGVYTPEETDDLDNQATAAAATEPVDAAELIKGSGQAAATESEPPKETTAADQVDDQAKESTPEQRRMLRHLFNTLGATDDQVDAALAKRGVKMIRQLPFDQAAEIIEKLEAKVAAMTEGESRLPETNSADTTSPIAQPMIDEIKSLIGSDYELAKRLREHLVGAGKAKLAELTHEDGSALLEGLKTKNVELFFSRSLQKAPS